MVENAVIDTVVMYVKGWHNIKRDKGIGAEHLKYHLKQGAIGEVSLEELLNLGRSLRKYMEIFGEPFLEDKTKTGKVFEWQDSDGIRFRVTMDSKRQAGEGEGHIPPLSPPSVIVLYHFILTEILMKKWFLKTRRYGNFMNLKISRTSK